MPVADPLDLLRHDFEGVAIDVGRGKNELVNARRAGCLAAEIAEDAQQRLAAHAVGDHTDVRGAGLHDGEIDEVAQVPHGLAGAVAIVGVGR